jgi:LPS sulfotransferase NodH
VADTRTFLVLKLPRTGSSMFGRVLNAHPAISCANEFLNPLKAESKRTKVRALEDFYRNAAASDGSVGQTMNPFKYKLRPRDVRRALGDTPIKLVVLLRENLLKQSVSAYLARERGYKSNRDWVRNTRALEGREFDVRELVGMVRDADHNSQRLVRFAERLRTPALNVTYEQLQTDPQESFATVFAFLGAPPAPAGFDYAAGFKKMLSDDLREVVANFDDLEREPSLARYLTGA